MVDLNRPVNVEMAANAVSLEIVRRREDLHRFRVISVSQTAIAYDLVYSFYSDWWSDMLGEAVGGKARSWWVWESTVLVLCLQSRICISHNRHRTKRALTYQSMFHASNVWQTWLNRGKTLFVCSNVRCK